jgi:predicted phage baseplate assembly protein
MNCADDQRRGDVRKAGLNGIESINVSQDQLTLTLMLLGKAPRDLQPQNFRIDGGRRVRGVRVVGVALCIDVDPELVDCVRLTVDRPGDFSDYRLCVVEADPHGKPGTRPYPGFDPRYACLQFSFKQNCPNLSDCAPVEDCPPTVYTEPEIDYLAKDYASFRQLLLDRLSLTMPTWTERHVPDIGIALVELLAYVGDRLSYRQDAAATEAYLDTARLRVSVRRHARLADYLMHDGCAARAWVCIDTTEKITLAADDFGFATLPAGTPLSGASSLLAEELDKATVGPFEFFEPVHSEDVTLYPAHGHIRFWTWGNEECCLPSGATSATLVDSIPTPPPPDRSTAEEPATADAADAAPPADTSAADAAGQGGAPAELPARILQLQAGDVLVLCEVRGATTGAEADADPSHCQVVRLTSVTPIVDELYHQPLLEVSWAREDALTFDLCVTARGGTTCSEIEVGVAHGNVVLVDHGRSLTWCHGSAEHHARPPLRHGDPGCPPPTDFGCGCDDPVPGPAYPPEDTRFSFALQQSPVTQSVPFPSKSQQAHAQAQELLGVPDRARDRLRELARKVAGGETLSKGETDYLTILFGKSTLSKLRLRDKPADALRTLLSRFSVLLAPKLERLAELVRRARAGYVLQAEDEGWEIGHTWGPAEQQDIDPKRAVFRGPARHALQPDPRDALPAVLITVGGEEKLPWYPLRDLLDSGPTDRHCVGEVDDDDVLTVRFGDGRAGIAPPPGSTLSASYRVGNGRTGNVGRNAINRIVLCSTRQGAISAVWNPLPAAGGADPELVAEVRQVAPHEMRHRLLRAITADDYASLAGQVPGVRRAAADLRWVGSWYEAQVAVDPIGADTAPIWLLDAVRESLHRYRRIGHDLSVSSAHLVPLELALHVEVQPDYVAGHVRAALLKLLGAGRLVDGRLGFFHPDNLSFGTPIRISQIVAVAAAVPGVRHVEVTRLQPLFGHAGTTLTDGVLRLGPLDIAQLDNNPAQPERGQLTLVMAGGR